MLVAVEVLELLHVLHLKAILVVLVEIAVLVLIILLLVVLEVMPIKMAHALLEKVVRQTVKMEQRVLMYLDIVVQHLVEVDGH